MPHTPKIMWVFPKKNWFQAGASTHKVQAAGAKDVEYIRKDLAIKIAGQAACDWVNGDVTDKQAAGGIYNHIQNAISKVKGPKP